MDEDRTTEVDELGWIILLIGFEVYIYTYWGKSGSKEIIITV